MIQQRTGGQVYIALALATMAAVMSIVPPSVPFEPARFLLLANAAEATMAAGAIGEDPDAITPP